MNNRLIDSVNICWIFSLGYTFSQLHGTKWWWQWLLTTSKPTLILKFAPPHHNPASWLMQFPIFDREVAAACLLDWTIIFVYNSQRSWRSSSCMNQWWILLPLFELDGREFIPVLSGREYSVEWITYQAIIICEHWKSYCVSALVTSHSPGPRDNI